MKFPLTAVPFRFRHRWLELLVRKFPTLPVDLFPIRHEFRSYSFSDLRADAKAGLNVALLEFPQGMAYAMLAGLPIHYGILCSAVSSMVAPFFSRCPALVLGPTNASAVMILSAILSAPHNLSPLHTVSILVFIVGFILILGAFLRLASLLKFVSRSVIIGYLTGAALLIIANQIHYVLGTSIQSSATLWDVLKRTFQTIPQTNAASILVALSTILAILAIRKLSKALPDAALGILFGSIIAAIFASFGWKTAMCDPISPSDFRFNSPQLNPDTLFALIGPAFALAFLCAMEVNVMAKTVSTASSLGNPSFNPNQEMFALGIANLACSFFPAQAASGSLTRTMLNLQSGAKTKISGLISGLMCLLIAVFFGSITSCIPKASVAALIILVAISLVDRRRIRIALMSTRSDALVVCVTFFAALFTPLDFTIFLGVAVSLAIFLHQVSSPQLVEYGFNEEGNLAENLQKRNDPHIAIIHVEGELFFGAADFFREELRKVAAEPELRAIILRMRNAHHLDATSLLALEELILEMRKLDKYLLISGASREVYRILRDTGVLDTLGRDNFFMRSPSNPNLATRKALIRAQTLIGEEKLEIRIYHDPNFGKRKSVKGN
ncbi:MAG: SulP family inorganic anion transporter [Chthoniobacterales bacterium]|nr:SulP family inorganic anion transporter [Chthoniobacterales bacterium]